MLMLTRSTKPGKNELLIGDNIRIIFRGVSGHDQIKIGVEAPDDIQILRGEVEDDGRNR
jgi:carbon storage regulator CsrA